MKNFAIRTLAAGGFLIVMLAALLLSKYVYFAVFCLIILQMMNEYLKMTIGEGHYGEKVLTLLTGACFFALFFCHMAFGLKVHYLALGFIPILVLMVYNLFTVKVEDMGHSAYLFAALLYIALPFTLSTMMVFRGHSFRGDIMLMCFCLIWLSDIGAYAFGMAIGQKYGKKMCPSISPKKTWTGFWGGLLFTVAGAVAFHFIGFMPYKIWHCLALAVIINVTGVCGDLIESQWKRHAGLKDSGNVIPGHGGLMDRFDSSLTALPSATMYLILFGLL